LLRLFFDLSKFLTESEKEMFKRPAVPDAGKPATGTAGKPCAWNPFIKTLF
jgi:hypothetical protein